MLQRVSKLADKAVLVKCTIRRASLTKQDKQVTNAIQVQYGDNSLTALTRLFRDKASPIAQIMSKVNEVYQYHKAQTLPYVDAGPRILPNAMYFEYTQEMKHRIAVVDKMLDTYMPDYDQLVQDDVTYRNSGQAAGRAHVSEYPTADQFRSAMSIDLRFSPMPDARHFLFDLDDADVQACEQAEAEAEAAARADTIHRMLKPLQQLVTRLGEYQGQKGERFHNSIVENVIEGCQMARKLALSPTPELLAEIDALEKAAQGYLDHVEIIKGSANARADAKAKLEAVAAKMAAFA